MKSNLETAPILFISLLEFSSLPIGTSSNARFGRELITNSILSLRIFCEFSISSISPDISFDLENWLLSFFFDIDFFSCSSFSFFWINSLFFLSKSKKVAKFKSAFLCLIFFKKRSGSFLINLILFW